MKNLKSKILVAMLALMVITFGSLVFVFRWFIRTTSSSMLTSSMETLSTQAASNFDYIINDSIAEFKNVATSSDYAQMFSEEYKLQMLAQTFENDDTIASIGIYNIDGQIKASTNPICSTLLNPEDIKECVERDTTMVTNVYEHDNKNYFAVIVPLNIGDRNIISAAIINCEAINAKLAQLTQDKSTEIFVINNAGRVLFLGNEKQVKLNQNPIELAKTSDSVKGLSQALSTAINGKSGSCTYMNNKTSYTMGYGNVSYFDSTLVTVSDSGRFESASFKKGSSLVVGNVIMLFVLTLLFANFFSSSISKPIAATTERLRKLANGDTSSSVDVWTSKDELGVLSNSLGETVSCLRLYINVIKHGLEQISRGNLTYRMTSGFKGDFSQIEDTFNDIFNQLCNTFDSINHSAEQVTSGAVQVANSAHSLSQGATQQASAIEELSATLSTVSDQVVQNSESARDAYKIVDDNSHAIEDCNTDMNNLLEAMQLISDTTEEITQILKAIDEISFQTNILALNAAVEAAREGSKGFGVVADEVRRLAARTAEAAKQTSALIDKTSDAVTRGHSIAVKTAGSLREVEEGSAQICLLMRNIADASSEQSDAILQINTGVDQISDVVSANTATAIGSASASEELSGQSLILKNMIAKFKLYNSAPANAAPAAPVQKQVKAPAPAAVGGDVDYDFSIEPDLPTAAAPAPAPAAASVQETSPEPQANHSSAAAAEAKAQMDRVKNIFMKTDSNDDDDDDEELYKDMISLFGDDDEDDGKSKKGSKNGDGDGAKANQLLTELFTKKKGGEQSAENGGKKDISALFKIDDDDDKY